MMHVGYLYRYRVRFPQESGSGIHSSQLISSLNNHGVNIHRLENEPIDDFLKRIDILYVRIDGHLLHKNDVFIHCIRQAILMAKPMVWEINAPAEERLWFTLTPRCIFKYASFSFGLPEKLMENASRQVLHRQIEKEETCRKELAPNVQVAICMSESLKNYARHELGIRHCVVIPNASDPNLFSPHKKVSKIFSDYAEFYKVIYVARGLPWQAFRLIAELANIAAHKKDKIVFIVLDSLPWKLDFIRPRHNLLVFNRVPYQSIPDYIASVDLCLCLYHRFSHLQHGFYMSSLKLFDYMASAKPTIASNMGQLAEIIEDGKNGLLTNNDMYDIYDKILYCRAHKDIAQSMGRASREHLLRNFTWDKVATNTVEVFSSVLNRKGCRNGE